MKNNDYILQTIMQPKGLKSMQSGGSLRRGDRFVKKMRRKQKKSGNKIRKATIKQCERDSKLPMCKRIR
tara:strand:- start:648 stop:854 length:207 start_codon:yes stop_codon:yes gene_type:complete